VEIRAYQPADLAVLELVHSRMPFIERNEIAKNLNDPAAMFAPSPVAVDAGDTVAALAFVGSLPMPPDDMRIARNPGGDPAGGSRAGRPPGRDAEGLVTERQASCEVRELPGERLWVPRGAASVRRRVSLFQGREPLVRNVLRSVG
jgi:hypothetical protein